MLSIHQLLKITYITGRAQDIRVTVADGVLNASFLIIEGQPMDICWGLDLMGQHGCSLSRENLMVGEYS